MRWDLVCTLTSTEGCIQFTLLARRCGIGTLKSGDLPNRVDLFGGQSVEIVFL